MILIGYHKCSTCQQAERLLKDKGISYTFREITQEVPSAGELATWYQVSGLKTIKGLVNTSGNLYKAMQLKDKLPTMSDSAVFDLLSTDGMLIKRPILVDGDNVYVGSAVRTYLTAYAQA